MLVNWNPRHRDAEKTTTQVKGATTFPNTHGVASDRTAQSSFNDTMPEHPTPPQVDNATDVGNGATARFNHLESEQRSAPTTSGVRVLSITVLCTQATWAAKRCWMPACTQSSDHLVPSGGMKSSSRGAHGQHKCLQQKFDGLGSRPKGNDTIW